jgi:hypothetical protein
MNRQEIRDLERTSIREFVDAHKHYLTGRVLDYGCGIPGKCVQPQPYRHIIEAQILTYGKGEYVPYDRGYQWPGGVFDAVLMTQVLQYSEDPRGLLKALRDVAQYLVMTYPTHWEEIEHDDRWRFTKRGVEALLVEAGWTVDEHKERWSVTVGSDIRWAGGYGVIAR